MLQCSYAITAERYITTVGMNAVFNTDSTESEPFILCDVRPDFRSSSSNPRRCSTFAMKVATPCDGVVAESTAACSSRSNINVPDAAVVTAQLPIAHHHHDECSHTFGQAVTDLWGPLL